ncbi:hypothetical protein M427DRAFT_70406 [Gonapodya prolifera JEL478]|uniref:Fatty acid hydroxylase domain-containing protein n=1 Tax=Gonapodya prolifera (strain JEL478) TaxID=1344416 RepID=A0A139ADF4_GONPJ|nr:hypothetical protein M427DRAFT_70406 [Gonapodya prolifera JEL478]|eukprot:KXS14856.1 hypothetical protein M427DRAFT_70406 [Gonapodya prolifera JEL478]
MAPAMSSLGGFWSGFWALQDAAEWIPFSAFLGGLVAFNRSDWSRNIHESLWSLSLPREKLAEAMATRTGAFGLYLYFGLYLSFAIIDAFQAPQWIVRHKVQNTKQPPPFRKSLRAIFWGMVESIPVLTIFNTFVVNPVWRQRIGMEKLMSIPSTWQCVSELVALQILNELIFYTVHRSMHTKLLYKLVHKMHHENITPFASSGNYAHPLETLLSTGLIVGIPIMLVVPHPSVLWFYTSWRNVESATAHCGYYIPGLCANTLFHDWHHRAFDGNYGFSPNLDYIFGTIHPKYPAWLANYRQERSQKVAAEENHDSMADLVDPYEESTDVKREI